MNVFNRAFFLSTGLYAMLAGCALFQPGNAAYLQAAVDIAVGTAEAKGVKATDINRIAHQALAADTGSTATVAAVVALLDAQIVKLKLPPLDQAGADILVVALGAAIAAKIGDNPNLATAQAGIAQVLGYAIAATGG
jgi:hypothetical protein